MAADAVCVSQQAGGGCAARRDGVPPAPTRFAQGGTGGSRLRGRPGGGAKCSVTGLSAGGYFFARRLPVTGPLSLLRLRRATKQRPPVVH